MNGSFAPMSFNVPQRVMVSSGQAWILRQIGWHLHVNIDERLILCVCLQFNALLIWNQPQQHKFMYKPFLISSLLCLV